MPRFLLRPSHLSFFVLVLVGTLFTGGVAGYLSAQQALDQRLRDWQQLFTGQPFTSTSSTTQATTTVPAVEATPLGTRPSGALASVYFANRRFSPVLNLVRKSGFEKIGDDVLTSAQDAIGAAVALTADGWLVTTYATVKDVRVADLEVTYAGRVHPVQKAVRDLSTDAVFLKINAQDLPVTGFVQPADVIEGSSVWMEAQSGRVLMQTVLDVHVIPAPLDPVMSERAARRFLISGPADVSVAGGGVWDADGRLIGLLEQRLPDGWAVLPSGHLTSALSHILSGTEIRHAFLGVRSLDLSDVIITDAVSTLPTRGAWIHADRRGTLPGIVKGGPAVGVLRDGDVIERIERDILDGIADLGERLLDYPPGTSVTLSGRRQGVAFQESVTLGIFNAGEHLK